MEVRSRVAFWVVTAAVALVLIARSGAVPLTDPEEARLARSSVEMISSGDVVLSTFEGEPRVEMAPLFHWTQGAFFRWMGVGEFAARLPAILATLGSLFLIAFVARRRFGEEGAAWAAAFFGTMPLVAAAGKFGTLDAFLAVHVLAAVAMDMAEPNEAGKYRGAAIGALVGLSFLAAGPAGAALPLLVLLAGRTAHGRNVLPGAGTLLSALGAWSVVVLPWGLAYVDRVGATRALEALRTHVLEPFFVGSGHPEPTWYYAKIMLLGFLPWVAPLALGLVRVLGRRGDPASRTALYAAAGLFAGLLFLSISSDKKPEALLPLAPLIAIVVTWELSQELVEERERRLGPGLLVMTLGLLGVLSGWAATQFVEDSLRRVALLGAVAYALAVAVAYTGILLQRVRWVYASAAGATFVLLCGAALWGFPSVARERSAEPLLEQVPELYSSRPILVVDSRAPSLTFYLERMVESVAKERLAERLDRGDGALVVIEESAVPEIDPAVFARLRERGHAGRYLVYEEQRATKSIDGREGGTKPDRPMLDAPRGPG